MVARKRAKRSRPRKPRKPRKPAPRTQIRLLKAELEATRQQLYAARAKIPNPYVEAARVEREKRMCAENEEYKKLGARAFRALRHRSIMASSSHGALAHLVDALEASNASDSDKLDKLLEQYGYDLSEFLPD